nr:hypothetical protein [Tanacetum cinerariifolium]
MSDMTVCLNDLSYILSNNEQNKSTQGDIGETSNEPTQSIRNKFEELYASANEELYPEFFQLVFPPSKGYKLPPSYYEIKKTFKTIGLGWKDNHTIRKKVPKKVLRYFSIIPRLQHLYKSSHTTKEMTWHATGECTELGKMQHPVDGRAWKNFDTRYLKFASEPRNVRLGLAVDCFNPFDNFSQSYNMWPVILTTYNLHPWLCIKESYLMLMSLILGPKSPGKDIDVYLRPLIDDLKDLLALKGVETISVATGQKFNKRVMVLWTINDFSARSRLSGYHAYRKKYVGEYLEHFGMNDKSKDTNKAIQDLKNIRVRSKLWLGQNKNRKCSKPHAKNSFTPENCKKFCQFIKGVKLPDGFGSNFKHKVTNNDTNMMGLKSHDCHIMMQHLLPYGLQQYLPSAVTTPIIELCSFFKQICSQTLIEAEMLKARSNVVDILCNLKLIYPPDFFDIMIHLVIYLPLEALEGGPIHPRWIYPFERFMKKLKNYVRNKAKSEGSIAEGYVAEEALTFSSHYFRDVTTKFNLPTLMWIALPQHVNFSEFPNKDMKEEFPGWFGLQIHPHYINKDPSVNESGELFALACGPTPSPISVNSCVVNGGDGQSMDVDAPPNVIDVNEHDDLIDDEDALPHDLADSNDEDLANNDDDDDVAVVYSSHDGDGGSDDRAPPLQIGGGCRGKGTRKPNRGGRKAGRLDPYGKTRNVRLRKITEYPPQRDRQGVPDALPFLAQDRGGAKGEVLGKISTQFDLTPHMQSDLWPNQKGHRPTFGQDLHQKQVDAKGRALDWDAQLAFWLDLKNAARHAQNARNRAKSTVICRQGSRSLAILRDMHMESSATREYPSQIHTYFDTHTVDDVFLRDEERLLYEEMLRLQGLGPNTLKGVPYTDNEIMVIVRWGKQRAHLPGVCRVLAGQGSNVLEPRCTHTADANELKRTNKQLKKQMDMIMKGGDDEDADDDEDEDADGDEDS